VSARGRAALLVTLTGVLAAGLHGAHGAAADPAPVAGTVRTVTATVQLGGTDGRTYVVTVTGRQTEVVGQPTTSEVSLGWKACVRAAKAKVTCGPTTAYRIDTTPSQFNVAADGSAAQLLLNVARSPLHLDWTRTSKSQSFRVAADDQGLTASDPTVTGPATATGTVFAVACHGPASVEVAHVVRTSPPERLAGSSAVPRLPRALASARHCLTPRSA
jgi:hypothetical protein